MPVLNSVFLLLNSSLIPDTTGLIKQLSPSSQAKFAQITTPKRSHQFLLGRWVMAQAASQLLSQPIGLDRIDDNGAFPIFANHPELHASISHSADLIGVIVSQYTRIGLDIENASRNRNYLALAKRAFHADEVRRLSVLDGEELGTLFYRIWTWREAAYKAGLIDQVVGGPASPETNHSTTSYTQSGKIGDFFWTAVSTRAFVMTPQKAVFTPT